MVSCWKLWGGSSFTWSLVPFSSRLLPASQFCYGWEPQWLEKVGVPYYISTITEGIAVLFFALDILCLVVFVIAETLKLLRLMWAHAWE
jgi:hypothetical protein